MDRHIEWGSFVFALTAFLVAASTASIKAVVGAFVLAVLFGMAGSRLSSMVRSKQSIEEMRQWARRYCERRIDF